MRKSIAITTIRQPLIILNKNLNVISANRSYLNKFHITAENGKKIHYSIFGNKQWNITRFRKLLEKCGTSEKSIVDFEIVSIS